MQPSAPALLRRQHLGQFPVDLDAIGTVAGRSTAVRADPRYRPRIVRAGIGDSAPSLRKNACEVPGAQRYGLPDSLQNVG